MDPGNAGSPELEHAIATRAEQILHDGQVTVAQRADRLFAWLMLAQWAFAIAFALVASPYAWEGKVRSTHMHVWAALIVGGLISLLPMALAWLRPGHTSTRFVVACGQMLWSALFIHLTGGRIETHFHVFGSLAFLAFYRDWRILVPATALVVGDHLIRGMLWPESVYGITNPEWWRFLEHAVWVVFEDSILVVWCVDGVRELRATARRQAEFERLSEAALDRARVELRESQDALLRSERLAAVGQLAASVSHELRNPLAAVRNASTFIARRLPAAAADFDPRIPEFLRIIDREVGACTSIITDLLDYARERRLERTACALRSLADEAISVVPASDARIINEIPADLAAPSLDRQMFRQVLVNLIQNGVEAMDSGGAVIVRADGGGNSPWTLTVVDSGRGIEPELLSKIFEPLFTTKVKGTGLGLAIAARIVRAHGGVIRVSSRPGHGATFEIELPPHEQVPEPETTDWTSSARLA